MLTNARDRHVVVSVATTLATSDLRRFGRAPVVPSRSCGVEPEVRDDGLGRVQGPSGEDEPTEGRSASPPVPKEGSQPGVRWVDVEKGQELFAGWMSRVVGAGAAEVRQHDQEGDVVEFGRRAVWVGVERIASASTRSKSSEKRASWSRPMT